MFDVGQVVVYSATGVCEIEKIEEKSFGSFSSKYYILKPLMQKAATIFVPTENSALTEKIHNILTKQDFEEIFKTVAKRKPVRPETEAERREGFSEVISKGDRENLILIVYDLRLMQKEQVEGGRRLHIADERLMNSAENLLSEEIAYVYGIPKEEALDFVKQKIAENMK